MSDHIANQIRLKIKGPNGEERIAVLKKTGPDTKTPAFCKEDRKETKSEFKVPTRTVADEERRKRVKDSSEIILNSIATNDYDKAKQYCEGVITNISRMQNKNNTDYLNVSKIINLLVNFGINYESMDQFPKALECFQLAKKGVSLLDAEHGKTLAEAIVGINQHIEVLSGIISRQHAKL